MKRSDNRSGLFARGLAYRRVLPGEGGRNAAENRRGFGRPIQRNSLQRHKPECDHPQQANLFPSRLDPLSLTIGPSGNLDFSADFVPDLTDALTYTTTFPLYSVRTQNMLAT